MVDASYTSLKDIFRKGSLQTTAMRGTLLVGMDPISYPPLISRARHPSFLVNFTDICTRFFNRFILPLSPPKIHKTNVRSSNDTIHLLIKAPQYIEIKKNSNSQAWEFLCQFIFYKHWLEIIRTK